jgi:hypothetical protein
MCEKESVKEILQSLGTRVPKIMLKRVEEIFPPLKEGLVSHLCLYAEESVLSSCSLHICGQKTK